MNSDRAWTQAEADDCQKQIRDLFNVHTNARFAKPDPRLNNTLFPQGEAVSSKVRNTSGEFVFLKNGQPLLLRHLQQVPTLPAHFITPYIHLVSYHVAQYLADGTLRLGMCQSMELLNNLQGGAYFRRNSRRSTWGNEILDAHYTARLMIADGITWKRDKYECGFCRAPYTYKGALDNHLEIEGR
eukprot:gb/GEZN01001967.1/.p1 GENE.gb/GEZN01001967.1/~~gb/GEZN01001967.1/.p1  ORF type:complete len:185 (-),score=8.92 gb/GEZN01001967.1/:300-854(-)